jgi:hypothetical protein
VTLGTRVRLCLKDLYQQDIVEMIERETRRYELHSIENPDHPDFTRAYEILWNAFGPQGEMEPEHAIRRFLRDDAFEPLPSGTFIRYFLLVAKDREGNLRGVRDGSVIYNPKWAPDLCTVYLSHIFMLPEARGTVLTYWLRIAPLELAVEYLFPVAPARPRGAAAARSAGEILRRADEPCGGDGVLLARRPSLAAAHPVLRARRLRCHRPASLPVSPARLPRSGGHSGDRQHAGALHAPAAAPGP